MKTKLLELRDRMTFIVVLAVDMQPDTEFQRWALRRYGYPCDGTPSILLTRADGSGKATTDPYHWDDRTFTNAHDYILRHWRELSDGDVVDVEFIRGESAAPKVSERLALDAAS